MLKILDCPVLPLWSQHSVAWGLLCGPSHCGLLGFQCPNITRRNKVSLLGPPTRATPCPPGNHPICAGPSPHETPNGAQNGRGDPAFWEGIKKPGLREAVATSRVTPLEGSIGNPGWSQRGRDRPQEIKNGAQDGIDDPAFWEGFKKPRLMEGHLQNLTFAPGRFDLEPKSREARDPTHETQNGTQNGHDDPAFWEGFKKPGLSSVVESSCCVLWCGLMRLDVWHRPAS